MGEPGLAGADLSGHSLRGAGYEVIEAADGEEALGILDGSSVDMVITDITMPGMSGIELIRRIRSRSQYQSLPLVVLSTVDEDKSLREGRQAGATGWVVKPFQPEELLSVIARLIPC